MKSVLIIDDEFALKCEQFSNSLKVDLHLSAWDGDWFKRAWFDDGTPIGSSSNSECMIDSISQSWSVLSGATTIEYSKMAMLSAEKYLVSKEEGLIRLLYPPFDMGTLEPGYIKGYVPGVRENGGQYTHAAIWMIMAWAKLGDRKRTWELLNLINPINHSKTFEKMSIYKVEPYVMSADVYGVAPHIGRGGWSWYTGSASWMYQLILESFLGLKKVGDTLEFKPCIPDEWEFFDIEYQYLDTVYKIKCVQKHGESYQLQLDGVELEQPQLALTNDKADHSVIFH